MLIFGLVVICLGLILLGWAAFFVKIDVSKNPSIDINWYQTSIVRRFNRIRFDVIASALYIVSVIVSMFWYAWLPRDCRSSIVPDWVKLLFGLLVSVSPPLWFSLETRALEQWLKKFPGPADAEAVTAERAYVDRMMTSARAVWAAVVAVYAAVLISFK